MSSPIGARRMKTDLHTDTMIVHTHFATRASPSASSRSPTLSRRSKTPSSSTEIANRSQLPARATRLLNRSRMQHGSQPGSESPRSLDSFNRKTPPHRPSPHLMGRDSINSSDDNIFMLDKSLRNTMIQDVLSFKKQLIRLRSILQEPDEECLTRTDTLNPFEISNGQFFGSDGFDSTTATNTNGIYMENKELYNFAASQEETKQELADLRRQVVYLQSQMDDKDRTIRIQQSLIDKLETEIDRANEGSETPTIEQVDTINTATQTERIRPLSIGGQDGSTSPSECDDWEPDQLRADIISPPSPIARARVSIQLRTPNKSPSENYKPTNGSTLPTLNSLPPPSAYYATSPTSKLIRKSITPTKPTAATRQNHTTPSTQINAVPRSPISKIAAPRRIPRLVKQAHVSASDSGSGGEQPPKHNENEPINGSYTNNSEDILKLEHELYRHQREIPQQLHFNHSNHKLISNGNAINHIMHHSPPVAVKLKNNLNVLKSPKFLLSVNSEDEF